MAIAAPRIGSGLGYFICGWISLGVAAFAALIGEPATVAFAGAMVVLAGGLIGTGFLVKLFGLVERRLIDIQAAVSPPGTDEPEPARPTEPEIY